jgi:type I restriction enzyme S subunit
MELETFFEQFELLADAPNGVQKLRELILQLAVQRKLVPLTNFEQNSREISKGKRLSDFITIVNGYAFKSQWFVEDGIRLLRNANVGHGTLRWDDVAKITEERAKEFKRFKLDVGDIVISLDRPLISTGLKVARVSRDDLPCLLLQRVGKVEFKTDEII